MARDYVMIIREQRRELERLLGQAMLAREPMERVDVHSPLAQVVLGMRRAGKSVVCRLALQASGVRFGYVDFDDEALYHLQAEGLEEVLAAVYAVYGEVETLLFDELQNVSGWHLFVNRLLRAGKHVVVTGSNARLLSDELTTHLTGRYLPIEVLPFSFAEFCAWQGKGLPGASAAEREVAERALWERYFYQGGLPETFQLTDVRNYVRTLYEAILTKDILRRHSVRNVQRFQDAAYVLMQQFAREVSMTGLAASVGIASAHTVQTYLHYLCESYLVSTLRAYSRKPAERVRNVKLYVSDPAFISYFTGVLGSDEELGWRLENIIYLELRRRRELDDVELYYYKDPAHEVDFCQVRHGKVVRLIQVSYALASPKTRKRELAALVGAGQKLGCRDLVLITNDEVGEETLAGQTICLIPARRWLLEGGSHLPPAPAAAH
ncbi:MAG: ATP-binding protein [Candidatus Spyradenecus sp.]